MSRKSLPVERKTNKAWPYAALFVLAVFLLTNFRLVKGSVAPMWDADAANAPYYTLLADHARAFRFLLWNPWVNAGTPDYAEAGTGSFSPLQVFMGLITGGTMRGFLWYWLAIWFFGAAGMFLLGRHLRAPAWGAACVALLYAFSGLYIGNAEHTTILYSFSTLPWVIWRLDAALLNRRVRPAIEAAAFWGLSALGGYAGIVMLNGCVAALWALGRCVSGWEPTWRDAKPDTVPEGVNRPPVRFALVALGLVLVIGVIILTPHYVPFYMVGKTYTDRAVPLAREKVVNENALHPRALTTIASPYPPTLTLNNKSLWSYTDISMCNFYFGGIGVWLAVWALWARPRELWRWWLAGMVLLSLGLAMGQILPLRGWLYDLFPPSRFFRHAALFRGYALVGIAVLALIGSRDLVHIIDERSEKSRGTFWVAVVVGAIAAACYFWVCSLASVQDPGEHKLAGIHLAVSWAGVLVAAWVARKSFPEVRWLLPTLLLGLAVWDSAMTQRISTTVYNDDVAFWKLADKYHISSLKLANGLARDPWPVTSKDSVKNLLYRVAVFDAYNPFTTWMHSQWSDDSLLMTSVIQPKGPSPKGYSRTWYSRDVATIERSGEAWKAFQARAKELDAPPLLLHSPESLMAGVPDSDSVSSKSEIESINALPAAVRVPAEVLEYEPLRLALRVTVPVAGWLWVTDRWSPGWSATVNGKPAPVWGGNFLFRAVEVGAGVNEVAFTYRACGFPWLVILSWSTLAAIAAFSIACAVRAARAAKALKSAEPAKSEPAPLSRKERRRQRSAART